MTPEKHDVVRIEGFDGTFHVTDVAIGEGASRVHADNPNAMDGFWIADFQISEILPAGWASANESLAIG